jgi:hypothetical protein
MEIVPAGQVPAEDVYEAPMVVEAGGFTEMTQGALGDEDDGIKTDIQII